MNRQTQRRWAVLAAGLFLVSGCADGLELDRDDDISEHQEGILELSERIVFESECHERRRRDCEDGEHHGTFVANPEGPRILRFEMPFEFRAGQDFYFEFEAAPEQTPKWLALTVEGSFFSHLAPLTQVGNRWIARGHFELRHREDEPFAPRQMLRLQLVDEDMTAGRALRVPINFVDELRGTPSPRGVGLSGTTPAEALLFDGDMLWQGGGDGTLVRWSGTSGGPELTIDAHDGIVHDLALVDSGVLSVGADGMLLHHSREGELLWAVQAHDGVARALAVHQDIAITGGWDGKVVAFALEDGERLWETELGERVNDVIGGFHGSCLAALGRIALPGELVRLGEGGVVDASHPEHRGERGLVAGGGLIDRRGTDDDVGESLQGLAKRDEARGVEAVVVAQENEGPVGHLGGAMRARSSSVNRRSGEVVTGRRRERS